MPMSQLTSSCMAIMLFWKDLPGLKCKLPMTYHVGAWSRSGECGRIHLVDLHSACDAASLGVLLFELVDPALIVALASESLRLLRGDGPPVRYRSDR